MIRDSFAPASLDRAIWTVIALQTAVLAAAAGMAGFSLAWSSALEAATGAAVMAGLTWFYTARRPDPRIAAGCRAMLQLIVMTAIAAPLSYIAASLDRPLWDATFAQWDTMLGLDWRAYFDAVVTRPALHAVLKPAYDAMIPAIAVAVLAMAATWRFQRLQLFVLAFTASCTVAILLSAAMPALNAYVHAGLTEADAPQVALSATTRHLPHLMGLRDGTMRVLVLSSAEGIITFPSVHTAAGVLLIIALWPVRVLRWISLGFNLAMIATTPVDGSHYFVDVLAGAVIAAGLMGLGIAATRRRDARSAAMPLGGLAADPSR